MAAVRGSSTAKAWPMGPQRKEAASEPPIRSAVFGPAAFQDHGRELARVHEAALPSGAAASTFYPRLNDNLQALKRARAILEHSVRSGRHVGPAALWLLDNASLVDEQVHAIRQSLPRSFFRALPCLRDEPLRGLPRVYGLAWAYVAHADSAIDAHLLQTYLEAYLRERALLLKEAWALPATLRVVLVENLRRLAQRVAAEQAAREAAHTWFDRPPRERTLATLEAERACWAREGADATFMLHVERRMEQSTAEPDRELAAWLAPCREWLAVEDVRLQGQAAEDQQSLRNAILGLRQLDRVDWRGLWLAVHPVVRELRSLPLVPLESEDTQDRHLEAVARLARQSDRSETAVARAVVRRCQAAGPRTTGAEAAAEEAPGHWLQGAGEDSLRGDLGLAPRRLPRLGGPSARRMATVCYAAALGTGTLAGTLWGLGHGATADLAWPGRVLIGLLLAFPISEAVVALLHRLISESTPPARLPRLALAEGLQPGQRTLVVMPCLLGEEAEIRALADQLEQHHLANPEAHTQFALLSDPADADAIDMPEDAVRLKAAVAAVDRLNARYPVGAGEPLRFLLLHRGRRWSDSEQRYIGWERKRGKLEQLIEALARGGPGSVNGSGFLDLGPLSAWAGGVEHLVTLDSDTDMPPGRLRALVAVAAHPLNRPRLDAQARRVQQGWGILQPRVVTPLPVQEADTWFHRLFRGGRGIDPYSAASSEVYQDLFGEGTYTGKGLIHVQAAAKVLAGRLPDGQVLSHDLLEGALMRCAGVGDVTIVEDAPLHSDVAASRLHRWTRGDWQLLRLAPDLLRAGLPVIHLWKMLDNLRRSLVAPASAWLLVMSMVGGLPSWPVALAAVGLAYGAGPLLGAIAGLAPSRDGIALQAFFRAAGLDVLKALLTPLWHLLTLLDQAVMYADAVGRACWRQFVSRRHLLAWTTAAQAQAAASVQPGVLLRRHAAAVGLSVVGSAWALWAMRRGWTPASPLGLGALGLAWALTPLWVREASRPRPRPRRERLGESEANYLRHLSRDTWRFYVQHVGAEDHHLPPDNVQIVPHTLVAHRTSPTNIGLYLLSVACAQRLGFIGRLEMADRLEATLATVEALPRHRGHLYNWYDTRSLAVLPPAYVSTVDSGNAVALLRVLAQACEDAARPEAAPAAQAACDQALKAARARVATLVPLLTGAVGLQGLARVLQRPEVWPPRPDDAPVWREELALALAEFRALRLQPSRDDEGGLQSLSDPLETLHSALRDLTAVPGEVEARLHRLAARARALAESADFGMLYDPRRRLLRIGWRGDTGELDANHYDLLASESRLTSLVAIAKGDVPPAHWAALGRPCFARGADVGLKSWSGSMFEYLMPTLVLDEPPDSLLGRATRMAVREQQQEARSWGTPWGVSECGIAAQDHTLAYQYGPQGVRSLALRRTPEDERVLAPYATALATLLVPSEAVANLRELERLGLRRSHGFVEALDYTPARQVEGRVSTAVQSHMAHHQAMSLLAWTDLLTQGAPRRWAAADPHLRAVQSLLHETPPREVPRLDMPAARPETESGRPARRLRVEDPAGTALATTALLGHGSQAVWIDARGVGTSRWNGLGLTRWRDDPLRGETGSFAYLEGAGLPGRVSLSARPAPDPAARYASRLLPDRVVLEAHAPLWRASTTVWVAPEDEAEVREFEIESRQARRWTFSLASEMTLAPPAADAAHPAFSNLFVAAQWDADQGALYFMRRPRLPDEAPVYACLFVVVEPGAPAPQVLPCVDRARWVGRGGCVAHPLGDGGADPVGVGPAIAGLPGQALDTGLDPMGVLRIALELHPGQPRRFSVVLTAADQAQTLLERVDRYRRHAHVQRGSNMSHTLAGVRLHELQLDPESWDLMLSLQTLMSAQHPRALPGATPATPGQGPAGPRCERRSLWRHGISGERPLILVDIEDESGLPQVQQLKAMLRLWSLAGLGVDLVVVNAEAPSYLSPVRQQLADILARHRLRVAESGTAPWKGSLHVLAADSLGEVERATLEHLARVHLHADGRTLTEMLARRLRELERGPGRAGHRLRRMEAAPAAQALQVDDGRFDPEHGAFRFSWSAARRTPRPWVQILANPGFGTQLSERGAGMSWAGNSRMQPLTPWFNDPLVDEAGEGLWLQDLDSGKTVWLGRDASDGPVQVRHQPGLTEIAQSVLGLEVKMRWVVDAQQALKQCRVHITNPGPQARRLRLVGHAEWWIGDVRHLRLSLHTAADVLWPGPAGVGLPAPAPVPWLSATQLDDPAGFGRGSTAFVLWRATDHDSPPRSPGKDSAKVLDWTCDRRETFDRDGRRFLPDRLGQRQGAGLDACAVLAHAFTLEAGAQAAPTWLLGHVARPEQALEAARAAWLASPLAREREVLEAEAREREAVQVRTPDARFDALVNHWLPYQTRVCRLWARAGFYQAGGALGFRDQLQDAAGLVAHAPHRLAEQIRVHARRQFAEGDVQHWWHEPNGAGVRTHFSDDLLWLPWAIGLYLDRTEDQSLLDEPLPFLQGREVPAGREDLYEVPEIAAEVASVYEHGARAIDRSLPTGPHGLPHIGTGDWNDGMNRVGHHGQGESVWLAWFLCAVVDVWLPLAEARGEAERAGRWRAARAGWARALEDAGWDGAWYRRAFFDDGSPLGSAANDEARIDLIAQAWSVLSAAGSPARARTAMASACAQLHDVEGGLLRLLWPPLQQARPDAGYIQAYPPGVRENGGQYNHGAVWALMALARLGEAQAAWDAFQCLSPAHRSADPVHGPRYGLEPYVMAGDVYTAPPYVGRGGWSWYTGSSGWLLRAALEEMLGVVARPQGLSVRPCLPPHWPAASVHCRHPAGGTVEIRLLAEGGGAAQDGSLDGPPVHRVTAGAEGVQVDWSALPPGSALQVSLQG